jgi:acid stress-induced BolA-like protein IbaG/YrbA
MTSEDLKSLISSGLPCEHITMSGDGQHWYAVIVSSSFEGKRLIQRHQAVYATLGGRIQTNEVHALSMKTYTPAEWAAQPNT